MSEFVSSCAKKEQQFQIKAAEEMGNRALKVVDQTYGSGYPLWVPGRQELSYHNGHHGRMVGSAATKLCAILGLSKVEQSLAGAAGYAHDIIQLKGRGVDESESAQWLEKQLERAAVFSSAQKRIGALAIIGTEPIFNNGELVGQRATELEYATQSEEIVAKSVASGDLGELYTPEGPYLGHQLFREIHGMLPSSELPFDKLVEFQKKQVGLLERYRYPLPQAETLLATHRPQVLHYSHGLVRDLERGTIESWSELIRRDQQFIASWR